MGIKTLALTTAFALTAGLGGSGGAFADVTVRMMHVEQNQDISGKRVFHPGSAVSVS